MWHAEPDGNSKHNAKQQKCALQHLLITEIVMLNLGVAECRMQNSDFMEVQHFQIAQVQNAGLFFCRKVNTRKRGDAGCRIPV